MNSLYTGHLFLMSRYWKKRNTISLHYIKKDTDSQFHIHILFICILKYHNRFLLLPCQIAWWYIISQVGEGTEKRVFISCRVKMYFELFLSKDLEFAIFSLADFTISPSCIHLKCQQRPFSVFTEQLKHSIFHQKSLMVQWLQWGAELKRLLLSFDQFITWDITSSLWNSFWISDHMGKEYGHRAQQLLHV